MIARATALDPFALESGAVLYYYWNPTEIEIHHLAIPEGGSFSGDIVLPSEVEGIPITSMKEDAFADGSIQTRVQTVTVPGSIKEIPDRLFEGCAALQEVTFQEGVERLSKAAFLGCSSLAKIVNSCIRNGDCSTLVSRKEGCLAVPQQFMGIEGLLLNHSLLRMGFHLSI